MNQPTVLVVDDEARIVDTVRLYLERDGFRVIAAQDGRTALEVARREKLDIIVLDLMLPEMSGWDVCRAIRSQSTVPIIMLTARSEEVDRVLGLELGADDYVTKPFSPRELVARVRAVLRRTASKETASRETRAGNLTIDIDRHEVRCGDEPLLLTRTEFAILAALAQGPGRVHTRAQLIQAAQGYEFEGYDRVIDSHIKNLRRKLPERAGCRIVTVRGLGYKLQEGGRP